jgi:hypothetical protein
LGLPWHGAWCLFKWLAGSAGAYSFELMVW